MLENAEVLGIKGDPKEKAHIYFRSGHVSSRRLTDCPQENGRQCRRQADRGGVCQGQIWTGISGCGKLYLKLRSKTSDRKTNGRLFFAWVSFIVCFRYTLRRFVVNYVFCAEILVVKTNCHLHVCSGGFLFSLLCGVIAWAWSRQHRASQPEGLVLRTVSGYWRLSHIVLIVLRPVSGFRWLTHIVLIVWIVLIDLRPVSGSWWLIHIDLIVLIVLIVLRPVSGKRVTDY